MTDAAGEYAGAAAETAGEVAARVAGGVAARVAGGVAARVAGGVATVTGPWTTVPEVLEAVADRYPDHEAFVDGDRRMTFSGLARAAAGLARELARLGVGRGDVICLVLPSSIDYAVAYHAAMRLGAVTSGVNPRLGPAEVASVVARTRPVVTIVGDDVASPGPRTLPRGAGHVISRTEAAAAHAAPPSGLRGDLDASDPVAVVWTSGTTGEPKGAVFDHANLRAVADGIGVLSRPGDRKLSPLPFAHVGYMTRAWDELRHVITTVIVPTPWRAAAAVALIGAERVTVAQGVPAQWSLMLDHPDLAQVDTSTLRLAGIGASPAPPELIAAIRSRLGCPVINRYTSTEAALTTGTRPDDPDELVAATVGTAGDGVEVRIVDDDGRPLPQGDVGTVSVRSGAVMRGYWDDPERTVEVLSPDGWLATGDLGRLDDCGFLTLVGRRSELYIRGGYNVYPTEVEAALGGHPGVDRVAVVGRPDPVLGEIGVAVVVPAGRPPSLDDLRTWCRARLADYKAPDRLVLMDELPLTAMAKIDKRALAAMLEPIGSP